MFIFFLPSTWIGLVLGIRVLSANPSVMRLKNVFPVMSLLPKNKNTPDTTGIGIFFISGRSRIVEASME
jgi:hypothetical protein